MPDPVKERVVLVTGATSGIGLAAARAFARAGATVVGTGRDAARLDALAREVDLALVLDVTKPDDVEIAVAAVLDRHGGVDVLVNNAGVGLFKAWDETTPQDLRRVFDVDFFGQVELTRRLLPSLIARKGAIVQVASVAAKRGYPRHTAYCAAKHALVGWSEALRQDLAGTGCDVVVVCPPAVRTPFFENAGYTTFDADHPGLALMRAEAVADAIVEAARRRPRQVVLGARAKALYAASLVAPGLLDRLRRR
ncbi:MAG: SDR family NAD(P)-dependent oxidoreductase [Myxococcota bacterium]